MTTYQLSDNNQNQIDFYTAKAPDIIEEVKNTSKALITTGGDVIKKASETGIEAVDTSAQLVMQHSLIAGAVGGLLLYAITSKLLYAGVGLVGGYLINNALDKSTEVTVKTPFGDTKV